MALAKSPGGNDELQVEADNGHIHLPSERPITPPSPLSTVPFRRDPDFVDCGSQLDLIYEKGSVPGSRVALVGLGGVGKSQLAIEFTYRIRDRSPETWVFWIHASNAARFEQSCRDIADRVKIPGRQDPKADIFKLLHDWLHDDRKGKWVLVLDNVDDDQFLHEIPQAKLDGRESDPSGSPGRSIWSYFSGSLKGSIVITSRSSQMASRMVEDSNIIKIEPMDKSHAITLFEKKCGVQVYREDVIQLITALEFMPLAIMQAAAYIKQRAPRLSVLQYLQIFQRSDCQKIKLLDYEGWHLRRDSEAKNSILVTWQISFDHLREKRPSAADLLSLMSFFDRQGIPDIVLRENNETRYDIMFEDDILVLRDYSMISISADGRNFEMHRLVQLAIQEWLKAHGQLERWKERFIRSLWSNFPAGRFENWARCQSLFAHVQYATAQRPDAEASLEEWASLLHEAASFAWTRGNLIDSKRMAEEATRTRKKLFGLENEKTLSSTQILGLAYSLEGQWKKAEELLVQVMETRKQVLGPDHPDTFTSINNLASLYRKQGRWREAEQLLVQAVETSNIQGQWGEAEHLLVQVIETRKQMLGPEHPDTLASMNSLASIYMNQGQWEKAEDLQVQVIETRKQVLGPKHPDILTSINTLASLYKNQGRWKEAKDLLVQVMGTSKQVLEPTHPDFNRIS
ncbi:P-loop containing nucleoside triphosphate hydrolase protein [Aspergillus alliaceus]|uniref:P-loop containing nucleoside triphosphate hydrolase protein n=1 Tax=Petromyces alliaceus TaxID=209559 RepID=UPI0012A55AC5|nr:P-loop containing nucleoside triphosphate hydrolase protein [Aspergillus alliaceus]KAB8229019.1 P-loop containing nucleoside triphosphate hydrolase protein [Aspergillus alliaceus]